MGPASMTSDQTSSCPEVAARSSVDIVPPRETDGIRETARRERTGVSRRRDMLGPAYPGASKLRRR